MCVHLLLLLLICPTVEGLNVLKLDSWLNFPRCSELTYTSLVCQNFTLPQRSRSTGPLPAIVRSSRPDTQRAWGWECIADAHLATTWVNKKSLSYPLGPSKMYGFSLKASGGLLEDFWRDWTFAMDGRGWTWIILCEWLHASYSLWLEEAQCKAWHRKWSITGTQHEGIKRYRAGLSRTVTKQTAQCWQGNRGEWLKLRTIKSSFWGMTKQIPPTNILEDAIKQNSLWVTRNIANDLHIILSICWRVATKQF